MKQDAKWVETDQLILAVVQATDKHWKSNTDQAQIIAETNLLFRQLLRKVITHIATCYQFENRCPQHSRAIGKDQIMTINTSQTQLKEMPQTPPQEVVFPSTNLHGNFLKSLLLWKVLSTFSMGTQTVYVEQYCTEPFI